MIRKILLISIFYSWSALGGVARSFQDELVDICGKGIIPIAKKVLIQIIRSEKTHYYSCDFETSRLIDRYCQRLNCQELIDIYIDSVKSNEEI